MSSGYNILEPNVLSAIWTISIDAYSGASNNVVINLNEQVTCTILKRNKYYKEYVFDSNLSHREGCWQKENVVYYVTIANG